MTVQNNVDSSKRKTEDTQALCFVIMPISDQSGYQPSHFNHVYEDVITPAVVSAGYQPVRADQVHAANMIHLDIIGRILDAPLAICDISSINPNVMFELGLRQAFDKPVVLLKDHKTPNPFDISPIRYVPYDETLGYRSVLSARENIRLAIEETMKSTDGMNANSIVALLGLRAAAVRNEKGDPGSARLSLIERSLANITEELRQSRRVRNTPISTKISNHQEMPSLDRYEKLATLSTAYADANQQGRNYIMSSLSVEEQALFVKFMEGRNNSRSSIQSFLSED